MPPNFANIQTQAAIINQNGSALLIAVRDFLAAKAPGGDDLTVGQKTTLRTNFLAALKAVEDAAKTIRVELAP